MTARHRGCGVGSVVLLLAVIAGCAADDGEGRGSTPSSAAATATTAGAADPVDATSLTAPPEATRAVPTAMSAAVVDVETVDERVVVAEAVPAVGVRVHTVAFGDGFVQLRAEGSVVVVTGSADGTTWRTGVAVPELAGLARVWSDGRRIVALIESSESTTPALSVSDDGGATWVSLPLPANEIPAVQFVNARLRLDAVAILDGRIVAVGAVEERVDWAAYSRVVLGEDHGGPVGEGGGSDSWTVTFEDGFELTVDLAAAGLPTLEPPAQMTVLTHDGSAWSEPGALPLAYEGSTGAQLAAGPAGFVVLTGSEAFASSDGITWTSHPVPSSRSSFGYALVGGPGGYILVGNDVLLHSLNGVEWAEVYRFEDLDSPNVESEVTTNPSAGGAGYLIPVVDRVDDSQRARVFWSADGVQWSEQPLPAGVQYAATAVSASAALVVPYLALDATADLPPLPADDADLAAAIAAAFYADEVVSPEGQVTWRPWVTQPEAACIGEQLVETIGPDRIRALRFGTFPFHLLAYAFTLPIEMDDATPIVKVLRTCSLAWELLMITSVTGGTDRISEESAVCTQAALDDDVAEAIFAVELARPYDDQPSPDSPDLSHLDPIIAAFEECLTPQELNLIDFN